jgi:hypothetical protein
VIIIAAAAVEDVIEMLHAVTHDVVMPGGAAHMTAPTRAAAMQVLADLCGQVCVDLHGSCARSSCHVHSPSWHNHIMRNCMEHLNYIFNCGGGDYDHRGVAF